FCNWSNFLNLILSLYLGNGRRLERLEMKITIRDLAADAEWFERLGAELGRLQWLQLELARPQKSSSSTRVHFNRSCSSSSSDELSPVANHHHHYGKPKVTKGRSQSVSVVSSTTKVIEPPPPPRLQQQPQHRLLQGL